MVKVSKLVWYAGLAGVFASGALNALFLMETAHMVTVQVPTHTLVPYQTIQANDVKVIQVPAKSLNLDTLKGNVIGRVTSMTIPQGDPIQSFEIARQGSMAEAIQHLYLTHPDYAFAQIHIQDSGLPIQPGQHVNFVAGNAAYPNVWVLSAKAGSSSNSVSEVVNSFVNAAPPTPGSGTLTLLIGAPWSTVQALLSSSSVQVVMGHVGTTYSLGSPPVNQGLSPNIPSVKATGQVAMNQGKGGVTNAKK